MRRSGAVSGGVSEQYAVRLFNSACVVLKRLDECLLQSLDLFVIGMDIQCSAELCLPNILSAAGIFVPVCGLLLRDLESYSAPDRSSVLSPDHSDGGSYVGAYHSDRGSYIGSVRPAAVHL